MSERPVYLDIGIGKGGTYVQKDPPGSLRIGLDRYSSSFVSGYLRDNFNIPSVKADGSGENCPLPFRSSSVDHIDVMFPLDELLYGLCSYPFIWQEFNRVLKSSGDIFVVVDEPLFGIQGVTVHGKEVFISSSHSEIIAQANDSGFQTSVMNLDPAQTRELGTRFAVSAAQWQDDPVLREVYAIRAQRAK